MSLPRLNAIVDADAAGAAGWSIVDLARAFLDGGAQFLQIRAKQLSGAAFLEAASRIVEMAHAAGAIVIVNDRADIGGLAGADGVHVGQDDLSPRAVRRIVGPSAIVGLSTHTIEQLDAAVQAPVCYVAIGPVFRTATKSTGYQAVGLDVVRQAAELVRTARLPLVAIGGITLDRAATVIDAGATSVAVIGDLLATGDPEKRVRDYVTRLASSHSP